MRTQAMSDPVMTSKGLTTSDASVLLSWDLVLEFPTSIVTDMVLPLIQTWPQAATKPVATPGIQTVPPAAPHSSVEESPAQYTETARNSNNSYSFGSQFLEILAETTPPVAELDHVPSSSSRFYVAVRSPSKILP